GLWAVQREINASERAARVLDYADSVTTLVHELQVERGLSTGHVAASNDTFRAELDAQRAVVDAKLVAVAEANHLVMAVYRGKLAKLNRELSALGDVRARIAARGIAPEAVLEYYTTLVRDALALLEMKVVHVQTAGSDVTAITEVGAALGTLADAKDTAGRGRAMGAALFGADVPDPEVRAAFLALAERETVLLEAFAARMSATLPGLDFAEAPERRAVEAYREIARTGGAVPADSALAWFATATDWIARLRTVEVELLSMIREENARTVRRGGTVTTIYTLAMVLSLLSGLWLGLRGTLDDEKPAVG
ncbi:MAG: nitrate- and nitrite sensing domain-containing protein, partial [Pseudomonadota bacterium]